MRPNNMTKSSRMVMIVLWMGLMGADVREAVDAGRPNAFAETKPSRG